MSLHASSFGSPGVHTCQANCVFVHSSRHTSCGSPATTVPKAFPRRIYPSSVARPVAGSQSGAFSQSSTCSSTVVGMSPLVALGDPAKRLSISHTSGTTISPSISRSARAIIPRRASPPQRRCFVSIFTLHFSPCTARRRRASR